MNAAFIYNMVYKKLGYRRDSARRRSLITMLFKVIRGHWFWYESKAPQATSSY